MDHVRLRPSSLRSLFFCFPSRSEPSTSSDSNCLFVLMFCLFVVELHVELLVLDDEFGEFDELFHRVAEDLLEVDVAEASAQISRTTTRPEHVFFRLGNVAQIAKAGHSVFLVVHGDFHLSRAQSEHSSLVQLGKSQELVGGGNSFGHVGRHFRRRRCLSRNVTKA